MVVLVRGDAVMVLLVSKDDACINTLMGVQGDDARRGDALLLREDTVVRPRWAYSEIFSGQDRGDALSCLMCRETQMGGQ